MKHPDAAPALTQQPDTPVLETGAQPLPEATVPAEKARLVDAAAGFGKFMADRFPQVSEQGRLHYLLAGSAATILLARTPAIEPVTIKDGIVTPRGEPVTVPPSASAKFAHFARKLGDIDIEAARHPDLPPQERRQMVESLPAADKFQGLSAESIALFGREATTEEGIRIKVDVTPVDGQKLAEKTARITVDGTPLYIHDPAEMVAWKVANALDAIDHVDTSRHYKYIGDFNAMHSALSELYSPDELARHTHDVLLGLPTTTIPYHNPNFPPGLKDFVESALATDPDANYLAQLQHSQERAITVLSILHRYDAPEQKQAIISFINEHPELIDKRTVNVNDPHNTELLIGALEAEPGKIPEVASAYHDSEEVAAEIQAVGIRSWLADSSSAHLALGKAANVVDDATALTYSLEQSPALLALYTLNPNQLATELPVIARLYGNKAVQQYSVSLEDLLVSDAMQQPATRQEVMQVLQTASETLDDMTLGFLLLDIADAAAQQFDQRRLDTSDRERLIREVLHEHGYGKPAPAEAAAH